MTTNSTFSGADNQGEEDFIILLYYQFVELADPHKIMEQQRVLCDSLGLKGRILLSHQGINGTVEGTASQVDQYIEGTRSIKGFEDMLFKQSAGTGQAFPKMSIKVRDEIVTTLTDDFADYGPHKGLTGKYLTSEELHEWFHPPGGQEPKEFYMLDMRNDYEYEVGHFKNAVMPEGMRNFRELKDLLPTIDGYKNKTVVTYCTGGIRCEVATGILMKYGFKDVYQLKDGIVTYMEKYPNEDFLGKLYVFDNRLMMGFNLDDPKHEIVGKCRMCGATSENLVDYFDEKGDRIHGVICPTCIVEKGVNVDAQYIPPVV